MLSNSSAPDVAWNMADRTIQRGIPMFGNIKLMLAVTQMVTL